MQFPFGRVLVLGFSDEIPFWGLLWFESVTA